MKRFFNLTLITLSTIALIGCAAAGSGSSGSSSGIGGLDIVDAQQLMVMGGSSTGASGLSASATESGADELYKVDLSGDVVKVQVLDESGNVIEKPLRVNHMEVIGEKWVMVQGNMSDYYETAEAAYSELHLLTDPDTGKTYDLSYFQPVTAPSTWDSYDVRRLGSVGYMRTNNEGTVYFKGFWFQSDGSGGEGLLQAQVNNGALEVSKAMSVYEVRQFASTAEGDLVHYSWLDESYSASATLLTTVDGIDLELSSDEATIFSAPDGSVYMDTMYGVGSFFGAHAGTSGLYRIYRTAAGIEYERVSDTLGLGSWSGIYIITTGQQVFAYNRHSDIAYEVWNASGTSTLPAEVYNGTSGADSAIVRIVDDYLIVMPKYSLKYEARRIHMDGSGTVESFTDSMDPKYELREAKIINASTLSVKVLNTQTSSYEYGTLSIGGTFTPGTAPEETSDVITVLPL